MIKFSKDLKANSEEDIAVVKDAILLIVLIHKEVTAIGLQYELMRCGIHITHPELKILVGDIKKEGFLADFEINTTPKDK